MVQWPHQNILNAEKIDKYDIRLISTGMRGTILKRDSEIIGNRYLNIWIFVPLFLSRWIRKWDSTANMDSQQASWRILIYDSLFIVYYFIFIIYYSLFIIIHHTKFHKYGKIWTLDSQQASLKHSSLISILYHLLSIIYHLNTDVSKECLNLIIFCFSPIFIPREEFLPVWGNFASDWYQDIL